MKEEYIVKLEPEDEYTHAPDKSLNYNESMYFNLFDHKQRIGSWFRLGNRPNEGYAEMTCCIYLPDGTVGFMFGRPSILDNNSFDAGGMIFEVVDPFKRLKVDYKGKVLLLSEPQQMMNPKEAFKSNPTVDCEVSLDIKGESPMFGGETLKKDGSSMDIDPEKSFSIAGPIAFGFTPNNLFVPISIVSGRSVLSLSVIHGIFMTVVSSVIPPESVMTALALSTK